MTSSWVFRASIANSMTSSLRETWIVSKPDELNFQLQLSCRDNPSCSAGVLHRLLMKSRGSMPCMKGHTMNEMDVLFTTYISEQAAFMLNQEAETWCNTQRGLQFKISSSDTIFPKEIWKTSTISAQNDPIAWRAIWVRECSAFGSGVIQHGDEFRVKLV